MPFTSAMAVMMAAMSLASATNFLDHSKLLSGVEDPSWYENNVPILEVPDQDVSAVYYYRWGTYREHMYYTGPQFGYLATEFLEPVSYGGPYGGISAAAGHHINEGRWLRDQKYGKDIVNYWAAGPGQQSKPQNDGVNDDTNTWATEYSFWAASAVYRQYLATGDADFATGHLDNLVNQYGKWDNHFDSDLGLYWQFPVWDGSEYTAASYETDPSDPYHGGVGYRPTINSYQYGDARAIAALATLAGRSDVATEYSGKADALRTAVQTHLWDSGDQFFKHMARDNNPDHNLLGTREIMGFLPWMFNLPADGSYSAALAQLKDPAGFSSTYGPTTAENRSTWFMHEATDGCCRWDGPSWPFATAQTLTAVENFINDYPASDSFSKSDYYNLLSKYVATQFKNGSPYVAEAHDPYADNWIYDSADHSEDYNHSTFVDNIIAGLIGLRGQSNSTLIVNPLTPESWTYFGLENAAYHGHNVTVIWDSDGTHYNQGKGLTVWVDGTKAGNRGDLGSLTVQVGDTKAATISSAVNIAANPLKFQDATQPDASYESGVGGDSVWGPVDGLVFRVGIPENARWTTYRSNSESDWFSLSFGRNQDVSDVRLYFYDDNDGVRVPDSYDLQSWDGSTWTSIPNQSRPDTTTPNAEIRITFPNVVTSQLRVVAPNHGGGTGWGLSEFQVWTAPVYQIRNGNSQKLMGIDHESQADSAAVQQYEDNGSRDHLWRVDAQPGGWAKLVNLNSNKVLAVQYASKADSAPLQQYTDSGGDDHLWKLQDQGNGGFFILNKNSGLLAGVDGESTDNEANIVQFHDNGSPDHVWNFLPVAS